MKKKLLNVKIISHGSQYSIEKAKACMNSASKFDHDYLFDISIFKSPEITTARDEMQKYNLKWTWADNNTQEMICPLSGLIQRPYIGANLEAKIGCFMGHFLLWKECVLTNSQMLILEHDSIFIAPLQKNDYILCQINDPAGATRLGQWWSDKIKNRGTKGIHLKTEIPSDKNVPDGLAGNSAYIISPKIAKQMIDLTYYYGVWPNDALMCRQLLPNTLQEIYPFVTKVNQQRSTSSLG